MGTLRVRHALSFVTSALGILVLCVAADAQTPLHPRWALQYSDEGHSGYVDQGNCGPLQKFTGDPKPFDYGHMFTVTPTQVKDDVNARRIGEISGHTVYNVIHNINAEYQGLEQVLQMKMVLMERTSGEFCDIFQDAFGSGFASIEPAYFIQAGETVLATNDGLSGTAAVRIEHYWIFDSDGPLEIDLSPIKGIVSHVLPAGYSIPRFPYYFEPAQGLLFQYTACKKWIDGRIADGQCGHLFIQFEVKGHMLVAMSNRFDPIP